MGHLQPSSSYLPFENDCLEALYKDFEWTFTTYQNELTVETGPVVSFQPYEFPKLICPRKDCSKDCTDVESLQTHLVQNCETRKRKKTVSADDIKKYIKDAKNTQERGVIVTKSSESGTLRMKCLKSSPLYKYIKEPNLKVYEDSPPPSEEEIELKILKFYYEPIRKLLFFDFTKFVNQTLDWQLCITNKFFEMDAKFSLMATDDLASQINVDDGLESEEGNPYSKLTFNGVMPRKLKWEKDMTQNQIDQIMLKTPVATVVTVPGHATSFARNRIEILQSLNWKVPAICDEGIRAMTLGRNKYSIQIPGIPKKKFTNADLKKYGGTDDEENSKAWRAQAFYEDEEDGSICTVLYEGWTVRETHNTQDQAESKTTAPILKISRIRASMLAEILKWGPEEMKPYAHKQRYIDEENSPQGELFWILEDMTYYHSIIQSRFHLGPVIYIALAEGIEPPNYAFSAINVMKSTTYNKWIDNSNNFTGPVTTEVERKKDVQDNACENSNRCYCLSRFNGLKLLKDRKVQHLRFREDGRLDLSKYIETRNRVVIECSNYCECSYMCKRRPMQRGQQKPLIVFYEGPMEGFGLRSGASFKKGEFIGEMTGMLSLVEKRSNKPNQAVFEYLEDEIVIDTEKIGNHFRFLHRSQTPNAILVETYSKCFETDPVLPRMAVYAARKIAFGEKITVS